MWLLCMLPVTWEKHHPSGAHSTPLHVYNRKPDLKCGPLWQFHASGEENNKQTSKGW